MQWKQLLTDASIGPDGTRRPLTAQTNEAVEDMFEREGLNFRSLWQEILNPGAQATSDLSEDYFSE